MDPSESDPEPETINLDDSEGVTEAATNASVLANDYKDFPTYYTPIYVLTAIFGAIFIIGPFLVKKNEYRGIIRTCILLSAFCMWIFWITIYIAQMNPLIGPRIHNTSLLWIAYKWGNSAKSDGGNNSLRDGFDYEEE